MTLQQAKRNTSGQLGPKLQGLGKVIPNKQGGCLYTRPACRLAE